MQQVNNDPDVGIPFSYLTHILSVLAQIPSGQATMEKGNLSCGELYYALLQTYKTEGQKIEQAIVEAQKQKSQKKEEDVE